EMVEANVVERCGRRERGDMTTQSVVVVIGANHHRQRIPADQRTDFPLHEDIAGQRLLVGWVDRIDERSDDRCRHAGASVCGLFEQGSQQESSATAALKLEYAIQRIEPL